MYYSSGNTRFKLTIHQINISMITIAKFNFPTDLDFQIFTLLLDQDGIEYICPEQNTIGIDPLLSIALGGLRVLVKEKDAERAIILLAEARQQAPQNEVLDEEDIKMKATQEQISRRNAMGCYVAVAIFILLTAIGYFI